MPKSVDFSNGGGRMSEEMSERIANVAGFKATKDDSKPFLGNGGSVGKHDTYPPSPQKWSLSGLMGDADTVEGEISSSAGALIREPHYVCMFPPGWAREK